MGGGVRFFLFFCVCVLYPNPCVSRVVINELYYDHPGTDTGHEFIELHSSTDTDISGAVLEFHNGTGSTWAVFWTAPAGTVLAADGIYLVGVGVGTPDTYNDELMDTVTDIGRGASLFVASEAEANKMFGPRFVQTMAVAARDVRVRLDLPPGFEIVKFSGEEFSSDPTEIEPQHLAPNDAMVFHQTVETCAPVLVDEAASFTVGVRWRDAITFEEREASVTRPIKESLQAETPLLKKSAAVFAYAEALKAFRDAPGPQALTPAFDALARAEAALPGDPDLAEIRQILEAL